MQSVDWRATSVPELRAILVSERLAELQMFRNLPADLDAIAIKSLEETRSRETLTAHRFARNLAAGEMFWVSADMAAVALDAAADIPGSTMLTDLPTPNGFMVLEKPLPPLDSWIHSAGRKRTEVQLEVDSLAWTTADGETKIESFCRSERVQTSIYGTNYFEPVRYFSNYSHAYQDFSDPELGENATRLVSFLAAAAILMSTPGVATKTRSEPRTKANRKAAKKYHSTNVTVITLNSPKSVSTEARDSAGRSYTHRWLVRGHWRQQPHGIESKQRRTQWIPSYVKGPEGLPLKETERVWAWTR